MAKGDRKAEYFPKVHSMFRQYQKVFLVGVDNVGSSQMHQIRSAIRVKGNLLMGKNTMIKKAMRDLIEEMPQIESLMPYIKGNVGLVFTNEDLRDVRDLIVANKVPAAAKVGVIAQCSVSIPAGNSGISPDKTSFFQQLGISTKVVKGAIEILNDVQVIKEGDRVGASEAELLTMLNITPFQYGCVINLVYDNGNIFEPAILDVTDSVIMTHYNSALENVASMSLALGIPTVASVPHVLINGFKDLLAVALGTEGISFEAADKIKEMLKNPQQFAPAASSSAPASTSAAPAKEEAKEESEEEMGFGLFD